MYSCSNFALVLIFVCDQYLKLKRVESSGKIPADTFRKLVSVSRWREKLLMTYSSWLVIGALKKKDRYDITGPIDLPSIVILENNSASTVMSYMSGTANSESSHTLYEAIVFRPFMKISDVYSSMARFESPTNGTYFITTSWSMFLLPSGYRTLLADIASSSTPALEIFLD